MGHKAKKEPATEGAARDVILVADDERNIRRTLSLVLGGAGYQVLEAENGQEAVEQAAGRACDLVLLDLKMPVLSGLEALELLKKDEPQLPVVVISGQATFSDAVKATQMGAYDFIEKPLEKERVLHSVRLALESSRLKRENIHLRAQLGEPARMVGSSAVIEALREAIGRAAPTRGRILVVGESGTGKELVARAIHEQSPLRNGPFIKVNCAAIPTQLIESELFGAEKGAFTGADRLKLGKFELAHGGTLFLDEIGDMGLSAQAKVLRILQTGELTRLGSNDPVSVDVRVVAATNKNLEEEIRTGGFREDLFYRINVVPLVVPPLRQRKEDIPELAEHFIGIFCRENGFPPMTLQSEALDLLLDYHWPGNVRELRNVIERLVIMVREPLIRAFHVRQHLTALFSGRAAEDAGSRRLSALLGKLSLKEYREEQEKAFILAALDETSWNVSRAATLLGLERTNLHKKISGYGLKK
jgi:two-component system nitrogen regulation response regulator NtrX